MEQNIRFEDHPEHAFYPIVEPFEPVKHVHYVTDLMYNFLIQKDTEENNDYPKWIQNLDKKQQELDFLKYKNVDNKDIYKRLDSDLFAEPFVQYEVAYGLLEEKLIGKVITPTKMGILGTIVVNNMGTIKINKNESKTLLNKDYKFKEKKEDSEDDEL